MDLSQSTKMTVTSSVSVLEVGLLCVPAYTLYRCVSVVDVRKFKTF